MRLSAQRIVHSHERMLYIHPATAAFLFPFGAIGATDIGVRHAKVEHCESFARSWEVPSNSSCPGTWTFSGAPTARCACRRRYLVRAQRLRSLTLRTLCVRSPPVAPRSASYAVSRACSRALDRCGTRCAVRRCRWRELHWFLQHHDLVWKVAVRSGLNSLTCSRTLAANKQGRQE